MTGLMRAKQTLVAGRLGWWSKTLDLLLPAHCLICGQASGSMSLCEPCINDLPWAGFQCQQCGLPLPSSVDEICGACIQHKPPFTSTVCPLQYKFPVDCLVRSFKFNRQLAAGRVLSQLMCAHIAGQNLAHPDVLIPVPLHSFRWLRRGFNQATELGNHISKVLGIPLLAHSLRRTRHTKAQSGLNRRQRRVNVRGAFYWRSPDQPPAHIALVDDVMTTGTTLTECARVLKKAGAKRVDVWVASRAIPARH